MNNIPKKNLIDALRIYKSTFGISELIAIDIKNNHCIMDVSNETMSLRISFDVDKQQDIVAPLVIEADKLLNFLTGGTSDILGITTKQKHILSIDKTKLSVPLVNYKLKTWTRVSKKDKPVIITSAHLFAQIAKTLIPFSTGGHHGILDSIRIRRTKKNIELVGTDGFRIGVVHITDDGIDQINNIDIIVPSTVLSVLTRLVKSDEPCSICHVDNQFKLEVGYGELTIELIAAPITSTYPDMHSLLAKHPDYEWEMNATDLITYCKLHRTVESNKQTANAKFTLRDKTIDMITPGESEVNSTIESVERIQGTDDHTLNMSLRFIMDAVNLVSLNGTERIRLGLCTKTNLVWLRADSANTSVKTMAVIVPMN